jgi:outer membrane protein assembly factor BamB
MHPLVRVLHVLHTLLLLFCRMPLPAPGSARVVFATRACVALVALLDGTLLALDVDVTALRAAAAAAAAAATAAVAASTAASDAAAASSQRAPVEILRARWSHRAAAPLFSSPCVDEATGLMYLAAVDGVVAALSLIDGAVVWRAALEGQVYADLLLLPPPQQQQQQYPCAQQQQQQQQSCNPLLIRHQQQQQQDEATVLPELKAVNRQDDEKRSKLPAADDVTVLVAATQGGWLCALDATSGAEVWHVIA